MFRLTALLLVGMFLALLIAGEDRGQLRPGLARAALEPKVEPVAKAEPEEVVRVVEAPVIAKTATASAAAKPVAVAAAASAAPEPARAVVQEMDEVFTLSNLQTEEIPAGPDATQEVAGEPLAEVSEPDAPGAEGQIMYVTANSVNVREGPSTEAPVLGKLGSGEAALVVNDVDGEWARIVIQGDGMEGFVAMRFLSAESP
ncbi:SH3 domain-containing protein [Tabrizicola sp. BL-A-41-H6]|uniref:SH3 domain-containing protein n=1 Tax=Tabrizicola sp. BL-A-41-H6 TaxID=3421107 RepID=UPI003D668FB1